jgi:hypothetical protein
MPVHRIEVGDIITFGLGSLNEVQHEVLYIRSWMTDYGTIFRITLDDGSEFRAYPQGHWFEVTKPNYLYALCEARASLAYGNAWDHKR